MKSFNHSRKSSFQSLEQIISLVIQYFILREYSITKKSKKNSLLMGSFKI